MKILLPNNLFKATKTNMIKLTNQTQKQIESDPSSISKMFVSSDPQTQYVINLPQNQKSQSVLHTFDFGKSYDFLALSKPNLLFNTVSPLLLHASNTCSSSNNTIKSLEFSAFDLAVSWKAISNCFELEKVTFNNVSFLDAFAMDNCPKLKQVIFNSKAKDSKISCNRQEHPNAIFDLSQYKNIEMELPFFSYSLYFILPHKKEFATTFQFSPTEFNPRTCFGLLQDIYNSPTYKVNSSTKFNLKVWTSTLNHHSKQDLEKATSKWNGKTFGEILNVDPNKEIDIDIKKLWVACANKTNFSTKNKWTYISMAIKELLQESIKKNSNKCPDYETVKVRFEKYKNLSNRSR